MRVKEKSTFKIHAPKGCTPVTVRVSEWNDGLACGKAVILDGRLKGEEMQVAMWPNGLHGILWGSPYRLKEA